MGGFGDGVVHVDRHDKLVPTFVSHNFVSCEAVGVVFQLVSKKEVGTMLGTWLGTVARFLNVTLKLMEK